MVCCKSLRTVTPAVAFIVVVSLLAETGDDAQLGFVGIPVGLLGAIVGGWIGFNWLPRSRVGDGSTHSDESAHPQ